MILSVNFHVWASCNMKCKYCFATFQDIKQHSPLTKSSALQIVEQLAEIGFKKITFVGGEPTLSPWLSDLLEKAKSCGLTTMITTNGTNLTEQFLNENQQYLDWIGLSIDSLKASTNIAIGRALHGTTPTTEKEYRQLIDNINRYGYKLKINTVVNQENYSESLANFIQYANPSRWKTFQVLPIRGQNDQHIHSLTVSEEQFKTFLHTNSSISDKIQIVPETNEQMKGSYAMVDPIGRFFENASGYHKYSRPILDIGARLAIQQMDYSFSKFINRGGMYRW